MLTTDVKERLTAAACLEHAWFSDYVEKQKKQSGMGKKKKSFFPMKEGAGESAVVDCCSDPRTLVERLRQYTHKNKLQQAALETIASNLSEAEIGQLRKLYGDSFL